MLDAVSLSATAAIASPGAWDEEAEFHPLRAQSKERAYHGHDGLRRFVAEIAEEWEPVRFEVDEIRAAGEQVVALGRVLARRRTSGVDRDVPVALVGVVRERKLVYSRCAPTRSEGEQDVSDLALLGPP